jgi:hypothetical protein
MPAIPLYQNIVVTFLFSVFPDQGLECFDLESSRVFFVKFQSFLYFKSVNVTSFMLCS